MKHETEIAVFEKISLQLDLGYFNVRKNEKESNQERTWWDVGVWNYVTRGRRETSFEEVYFIVEDHGDCHSFELFVWVHHPGNREEPPSSTERCLGGYASLGGALEGVLVHYLRDVIQKEREEADNNEPKLGEVLVVKRVNKNTLIIHDGESGDWRVTAPGFSYGYKKGSTVYMNLCEHFPGLKITKVKRRKKL